MKKEKKERPKKTISELCFVILINEIEPRQKQYGAYVPPDLTGRVVRAEFDGIITRKETRLILDELFRIAKVLKDGESK